LFWSTGAKKEPKCPVRQKKKGEEKASASSKLLGKIDSGGKVRKERGKGGVANQKESA